MARSLAALRLFRAVSSRHARSSSEQVSMPLSRGTGAGMRHWGLARRLASLTHHEPTAVTSEWTCFTVARDGTRVEEGA